MSEVFAGFDAQLVKQRERLFDLLTFARRNIPYYQEVIPADVDGLVTYREEWQRIPLLTKQQIQSDWSSFLANPGVLTDPSIKILATSGTTGMPLRIARPLSELRMQTLRLWASRRRWYPEVMRWKQLNLCNTIESPHLDVLPIGNDAYLDVSPSALAGYAELIDKYEPDWIYGSPSSVYSLAQHYRRNQRHVPTLKFIEVSGEELSSYQRGLIEITMGCPVANQYGCREFWVLSYECPAKSMHAWTEDLVLEVLRDGQPVAPGESGELVVTSLTNHIMPLIRYRLGDVVQMYPSKCRCGDQHLILIPVGGRAGQLIVTREKTVSTACLNIMFSAFVQSHEQAVAEYQVVQWDRDSLEMYIVPGECFDKNTVLGELKKAVHDILPEVSCEVTVRGSLPRMPSGKSQCFVSYVSPNIP